MSFSYIYIWQSGMFEGVQSGWWLLKSRLAGKLQSSWKITLWCGPCWELHSDVISQHERGQQQFIPVRSWANTCMDTMAKATLLNLSIKPLPCGWYWIVFTLWNTTSSDQAIQPALFKSFPSFPWSECIIMIGTFCITQQYCRNQLHYWWTRVNHACLVENW